MRKFVFLFFSYFIFICLTIVLICEVNIPDKKVIQLVPRDYSKVIWNINAINNHPEIFRESIVFIGSSVIDEGISDSLFCSKRIKAVNMGVSRAGFDLDYYFTNRILNYKPKSIYLARMPNGSGLSHPVTPLLISPMNHLNKFKQFNLNFILSYIPKRLYFVIQSFFHFKSGPIHIDKKLYGSSSRKNKGFEMGVEELNNYLEKSLLKFKKNKFDFISNDGLHKTRNTFKNLYRKLIAIFIYGSPEKVRMQNAQICFDNNINVFEIYIPNFADAHFGKDHNYLSIKNYIPNPNLPCINLGNVSFLYNLSYWSNVDHLNYKGSVIFTDSLIRRVIEK